MLVCSENKKISLFSSNAILKNTFYSTEGPLVNFDISTDRVLAICSLNNQNIEFISPKEKFFIKIIDGFPEIIKFIRNDAILVGSSTGMVSCFSTLTKKRISFLKIEDQITAMHVINTHSFLIGYPGHILLIDFSNFNKMEISDRISIDGIPVAFHGDSNIYCCISRESRIGRWRKFKEGHNSVLNIKLV